MMHEMDLYLIRQTIKNMAGLSGKIQLAAKNVVGRLPSWLQWELMAATRFNIPDIDNDEVRRDGEQEAKGIAQRAEEFQDSFDIESSTVLEIGCGYGRLLVPMASLADESYGIDISRKSLRQTRKYAGEEGVDITLARSEESIPFDTEFDLIYALRVFTHLPRRQVLRYLIDIREHLSEGGVLLFRVPSLEKEGIDDLLDGELNNDYPFRVRYYTKTELETILDGAGFSDIQIDGGWYAQASVE